MIIQGYDVAYVDLKRMDTSMGRERSRLRLRVKVGLDPFSEATLFLEITCAWRICAYILEMKGI